MVPNHENKGIMRIMFIPIERWTLILKNGEREVVLMKPKNQFIYPNKKNEFVVPNH